MSGKILINKITKKNLYKAQFIDSLVDVNIFCKHWITNFDKRATGFDSEKIHTKNLQPLSAKTTQGLNSLGYICFYSNQDLKGILIFNIFSYINKN